MKNWKYIEGAKTGNETLAAHPDSAVAQEIYKIYLDNGKDKKKALEKLSGKYKNIPSDALEKHLDDAIKAYAQMIKNKNVANEDKTGAEEFFKQLSDDVKEREKKDDADIEKVGNFKTGTSQLKPGDKVMSFGKKGTVKEVIGENTDNIYGEPLIKVEFEDGTTKTIGEHYMRKVGNKVGNALNWDENLVGKFVWVKDKGQEWKVYVMQDKGDKVYIRDDDGSEGWVSKTRITGKVGNTRTGNQSYKFYGEVIDIAKTDTNTLKEILEELHALHEQGDFQRAIKDELNKRKVGNSAPDDKFAYVMREFDEGKLKTPDGKVVTDPAQAKAIAYSESKKTENGLARARKAMNAWNSERKIEPVGKYRKFIDNLKNAIELGAAGVLYNSLDEQTVKEWVEKAKKEGYGSHISGVQGKKVILK